MPRLRQRQQAPVQGRVAGRAPGCIACGNRRLFWVRRDGHLMVAYAWEIQPQDKLEACGRCRSRHAIVFEASEG